MIVGIGIDIVEPERVFTARELAACADRVDRLDALAARFAAKEACLKALGTGLFEGALREVEIVAGAGGTPQLRVSGALARRGHEHGGVFPIGSPPEPRGFEAGHGLERHMVIVHVVTPAEFGGLERVVQMLGSGLRGLGHEVHMVSVATGSGADAAFLAPLAEAGVHTHTLMVPGRSYRRERAAIAALCRRVRPDVVHTHGYRPDVLDAGVARRLDIPVVTTVHGFTGGGWKNRAYE